MIGPTEVSKTAHGPHLTKLVQKLEEYDANTAERLSKAILELLESK